MSESAAYADVRALRRLEAERDSWRTRRPLVRALSLPQRKKFKVNFLKKGKEQRKIMQRIADRQIHPFFKKKNKQTNKQTNNPTNRAR